MKEYAVFVKNHKTQQKKERIGDVLAGIMTVILAVIILAAI